MENETTGPEHDIEPLLPQFVSLPHIHMKTKTILLVVAAFIGLVIVASSALSMRSPDYVTKINESMKQAEDKTNEAKAFSCEYIGKLTADCYAKRPTSCGKLEVAEAEYREHFNAEAYGECFEHDTSTDPTKETEQPGIAPMANDDPSNPLFFGDEETSGQ